MAIIKVETSCSKWRLIIKIELWTHICVLFPLIVWIHKGMYKPELFSLYVNFMTS